jgi:Dyp-type peroxidase family
MSHYSMNPIDLSQPIPLLFMPGSTYSQVLANLQGNILKPHGRNHAIHLLFRFTGPKDDVKRWIAEYTERYITSALRQLHESQEYKENAIPGQLFGSFLLTAEGYRYLGFGEDLEKFSEGIPPFFTQGMQESDLDDPDPRTWDMAYQDRKIHGLILLADDDLDRLHDIDALVKATLQNIADILVSEEGETLRDASNSPIEHFGYRDGISQPLFFKNDIRKAQQKARGDTSAPLAYDPSAGLDLVLVNDPLAQKSDAQATCFGSYLVFRKLEQHVDTFEQVVERLASKLHDGNLAGALIVGRFKDGTPIELTSQADTHPGSNNFHYHTDPTGRKCPVQAHIRKTNPRGDAARIFEGRAPGSAAEEETDRGERRRRIARRAIPYGKRLRDKDGILLDRPAGGVGLLFQCYQAHIGEQFAFIQKQWCNNPGFARPHLGVDPIIGQPVQAHPGMHSWPIEWGVSSVDSDDQLDIGDVVTMKGGEFFFAPSIPFLLGLGAS